MSATASPASISTNFSKSEHLQAEWHRLLAVLHDLDANDSSTLHKRRSIQRQLDAIKNDMANLVNNTRLLMPTSTTSSPTSARAQPALPHNNTGGDDDDDDVDENDLAQAFIQTHSSNKEVLTPQSSSSPNNYNVQYSARRIHVIRRTYDSSSEEEGDATTHNVNSNSNQNVDTKKLRQQLMQGKPSQDKVVVEKQSARSNLAASLKRGLRNTFRSNNNNNNNNNINNNINNNSNNTSTDYSQHKTTSTKSSRSQSPCPSPSSPPMPEAPTPPSSLPDSEDNDGFDGGHGGDDDENEDMNEEEREKLAIEQSRLERESRRLRRKPNRSKHDDTRLLDIASRLSKLSSTLADNVSSRGNSFKSRSPNDKNASNLAVLPPIQPSSQTKFNQHHAPIVTSSALSQQIPPLPTSSLNNHNQNNHHVSLNISPVSDESPSNQNGYYQTNSNSHSSSQIRTPGGGRRKKAWMAIEAVKTLGRSVLPDGLGRRASTNITKNRNSSTSSSSNTTSSNNNSNNNSNGNVYDELGARLNDRGQKLQQAAEGSEQMTKDAGDMAAAARALRQRQQNKGFFG